VAPNCIKIEVIDLELNTKTTYDSISQAARATNCNHSSIRSHLQSKYQKPLKGRYVFRKI
jgi:hypothetical protein